MKRQKTYRLEKEMKDKIKHLTITSKDLTGQKKYESESHFIRCAVIKLINEEIRNEKINKAAESFDL